MLIVSDEALQAKLDAIGAELRDQYRARDGGRAWILAYSGGKDSTLLLQLVVELLLRLAPADRARPVHVVCNDTLVENPIVADYVRRTLAKLADAFEALGLPITVHGTRPDPRQTFWSNLIGRGYAAPHGGFRWCTDRLKIVPTSKLIRGLADAHAGAVLLLGVRSDESSARAQSVASHGEARLNPHGSLAGVVVFRPIKAVTTPEVWQVLMQCRPPWGGAHRELLTLYRNALGGECPLVFDRDEAASCGSSASARFGCWTCTVVEEDRSLHGMIDAGFEGLEPLAAFRDWLKTLSADVENFHWQRRGGELGVGPFKPAVREQILARLLEVQAETGLVLITDDEVWTVKALWAEDALVAAKRFLNVLYGDRTATAAPGSVID